MEQIRPLELEVSPAQALARQVELASKLPLHPGPTQVELIGATAVAYEKERDIAHAAIVVLDARTLELVASASWSGPPGYPYVPGLFALREASCLLHALKDLELRPDVMLVDGQGIAHPRRFGLACLLGWIMDLPTIGCAKSLLCGQYGPLGPKRGDRAPLMDQGQLIGYALRTQPDINPVFTSPGYGYDVETATALTLAYSGQYRIPEPLRLAHHLSITLRQAALDALSEEASPQASADVSDEVPPGAAPAAEREDLR